jgi:hypothetical protein
MCEKKGADSRYIRHESGSIPKMIRPNKRPSHWKGKRSKDSATCDQGGGGPWKEQEETNLYVPFCSASEGVNHEANDFPEW